MGTAVMSSTSCMNKVHRASYASMCKAYALLMMCMYEDNMLWYTSLALMRPSCTASAAGACALQVAMTVAVACSTGLVSKVYMNGRGLATHIWCNERLGKQHAGAGGCQQRSCMQSCLVLDPSCMQ